MLSFIAAKLNWFTVFPKSDSVKCTTVKYKIKLVKNAKLNWFTVFPKSDSVKCTTVKYKTTEM